MSEKEYPQLCGGTFFILLCEATKVGDDDISNKDLFVALIRGTLKREYKVTVVEKTYDSYVSKFRSCVSDRVGTMSLYLGDNKYTELVEAFDEGIRSDYQRKLQSMTGFVKKYIETDVEAKRHIALVGRLLRLLNEDESLKDEEFYITADGKPCPWEKAKDLKDIDLAPFLLGLWHFAITKRNHFAGKSTFNKWCLQKDGSERPFDKNAFKPIDRDFNVRFNSTDNKREVLPTRVEEMPPTLDQEIAQSDTSQRALQKADSAQNKSTETQEGSENHDELSWLSGYREACIKEYSKVTVFHYPGKRVDFKSVFVLGDVIHDGKRIGGVTLSTLREWNEHIIIIGIGGMGKSMLMRHLFLSALEQQQDGRIPVFISLVKYKGERFYKFIADEMSEFKANVDESAIKILAEEGKLLLFLDALDEVEDASDREDIEREIQKFARNYEETQIIMSCRDLEDVWNYGHFERIDICPFSDKQAMTFIAHFMGAGKEDSINRLYQYWLRLSGADGIIEEEPTPLLLSIMATTFAETGMIAKEHFYEDAFYVMVETHDRNKEFAVKREFKTDLDAPGLYDAFAEYCFISYLDKKYAFTKQEVYNYVEQLPGNINRRGFLEDMVERACMFVKDGRYYKFVHRNFQQEFCASYMIKYPKEIRRYVERLTDENKIIKDDDEFMGRFIRRASDLALQYVFLPYMDIIFSKDYWYFLRMTHISIGITVQGNKRRISGKYGWAHTGYLYRHLHVALFGTTQSFNDATPIVVLKPYKGMIGSKKNICWDKRLEAEFVTDDGFDDPKSDNYERDYEEVGSMYYVSVYEMLNAGDEELFQILDDDKQCYIKADYNRILAYYEELKAKYPGS